MLGIGLAVSLVMITAYELLGITKEASDEQIQQAYHRMAFRLHPDRVGNELLEEFLSVKRAYDILMDPQRRACMAELPLFREIRWKLEPHLTPATQQMFENVMELEDEIKNKEQVIGMRR